LLAGGGGHSGYAFSIAQRLRGAAETDFLVPSGDDLSLRRLEPFGRVGFLNKARSADTSLARFAPNLLRSFGQALVKSYRSYDVVVSTGSNFCIPPGLMARLEGVDLVNIESSVRFTKASKTAQLMGPFSKFTVLQWEDQKRLLPRGTYFGPLLPKPVMEPWNGGYVLITGGTLGHRKLFELAAECNLRDVVLQTGKVDPAPFRERHPEWKVITSSPSFHEILAGAEVVVTHFGYTALETLIYRKPTVLVLNPEWKLTVGREDAQILADKINAAFIWDLTKENLLQAIEDAKGKKVPIFPDGAERLAQELIRM